MTQDNDRRLIEDYLPIEAISAEASREKSVRKGHISTLHLWWARRPLVACRAAVYGALVPAPVSKSGRGPKSDFVKRLCKYPGDPKVIAEAQRHILDAHAERLSKELGKPVTVKDIEEGRAPRPKVLDMFAGGGAIPLEALRLGCDAYALELNPVAHIIELCTLVYPQKYGKPDKNAKGSAPDGTWAGLAKEVEYWGQWVLERVKAEIGDLYPPISDPKDPPQKLASRRQEEFGTSGFEKRQRELALPGGFLTPVAYLWTRTIQCKNPTCGATVPLVRQTWLCKKPNRQVALKMIAPPGEKRIRFEVVEATGGKALGFDPEAFSKAGNSTCPFCGTVADVDYVKEEGKKGRMGTQPMSIVAMRNGDPGKIYLSADTVPHTLFPQESAVTPRLEKVCQASATGTPNEPLPPYGVLGFRIQPYGFKIWADLFTSRQLLCLVTFVSEVQKARQQMTQRGYAAERATAVGTFLAAIVDRLADFNSALCMLNPTGGRGVVHTFGHQALPMVWDFAETNPFNPEGASWVSGIRDVPAGLRDSDVASTATVVRGSAMELPWPSSHFDALITDPPYYDNVPYADLSDFFYVWLKRTVGDLYPEHFASELTPKKAEAIAEPARYEGDKGKAYRAYEKMMAGSFKEAHRVLKPGGELVVVYAHKSTLGWATLVDSIRNAGFIVTEAWPLDTEKAGRLRAQDSSALASAIFLVARRRATNEVGDYDTQVRPELESIVRERVETLWEQGVSGADLVIAAVGAGLRAFTRFPRVEYANGEEMPAERFLAEVEGVVLETLLEKIFRLVGARVSQVDGPSQFYVLWRYAYHAGDLDAGEAIVFTYGLPVELDGPRGLSAGARALVEKKKNKYQLRDYMERGHEDRLGLPAQDGTPAPLIDVLHRVLYLMEHQPGALPQFISEALPDLERLRLVANALAGPQLKGGENGAPHVATTAREQASLGKLVANWRSLMEGRITPAERAGETRRLPGL